jgi:hypothetical protein
MLLCQASTMTSLPTASVDGRHPSPSVAHPAQNHLERSYSSSGANLRSPYPTTNNAVTDFGSPVGRPVESSPLSQAAVQQHGRFNEEWDASQRGSSVVEGPAMHRSNSVLSQSETAIPSRGGTLKKKASLRRGNSLKRSGSRRSSRAGSVRSLALEPDGDETHSAFYSPIPTTGNPTEILANRFSGMYQCCLSNLEGHALILSLCSLAQIPKRFDHLLSRNSKPV